jgi:thiol:disulfide interchange protein DsbD
MRTSFTLFLVAALFMGASASAQEAAKWSATASSASVKAGETFQLKVRAKMNDKWHVYSTTPMDEGPVATEIDFPAGSDFVRKGKVRQPKPIVKFDDAFQINTEFYEDEVTFTLDVSVKKSAAPGKRKGVVEVTFMACNDRMCLPPQTQEIPFNVEIASAAVASEQAVETPGTEEAVTTDAEGEESQTANQEGVTEAEKPDAPPAAGEATGYGDEAEVARAREEGLWAYIGLAMSVGALALLTPCVFPMIPITVSFFTKREQATRWHSVRDALIYSFGIIFTFTGLGILLALTLGASGINQFAANPWMNIVISLVFIIFALNLFGLFEIVVPSGILTKLTVASGSGQGIASLLLMGLTFTLTSFTCTVPFVGTVMVAAASGEIWWSIVGMLAFSTVFALPFFLLALFPSWLKSMPKSGGWLNSVKVVMGFLELAAAMKFISNVDLIWGLGVLSRDLFLAFWVGIGIFITTYLLGKFQLPHDTQVEKIGVMRMMWSVFFLGISIYLFTGLNGVPLGELDAFLPPMEYEQTIKAASGGGYSDTGTESAEQWFSDYGKALAAAKAEGKPLFIDFTGFACTNCRWMEANVFPRSDVKELFGDYILVRLYTDGQGEMYERNRDFQQDQFGTIALPYYVTMSPEEEVLGTFPGMTRNPEEFVSFLGEGLRRYGAAQNVAAL